MARDQRPQRRETRNGWSLSVGDRYGASIRLDENDVGPQRIWIQVEKHKLRTSLPDIDPEDEETEEEQEEEAEGDSNDDQDDNSAAESPESEPEVEESSTSRSASSQVQPEIQQPSRSEPASEELMRYLLQQGAENCLSGLKFALTGDPYPLDQATVQSLISHFGGSSYPMICESMHMPYLILGRNPDPDMLEAAQELGVTHIRQTGLFSLIQHEPANGRRQKRNRVEGPRDDTPPQAKWQRVEVQQPRPAPAQPQIQRAEVQRYRRQTPPPPKLEWWIPEALHKLRKRYLNDKFDCIMIRNDRDPWDPKLRVRPYSAYPINRTIPQMCYDEKMVCYDCPEKTWSMGLYRISIQSGKTSPIPGA
jgi:hypothetical protein